MPDLQPAVYLTDQDLADAALHDVSGPEYYWKPPTSEAPRVFVMFDSSGVPEVFEENWVQRVERVLAKLADTISWFQQFQAESGRDDMLPGADFPVTLASEPRKRVVVRAVVSKVTRSKGSMSLSDQDLGALGWLEPGDE